MPAGGLLDAMVVPAWRAQVAGTGRPVRIGNRVVQVAVVCLGGAAGRDAGRGAGADQVPEPSAGGVPVLAVAVVAGAASDRGQTHVQRAQQRRELCGLVLVGAGWRSSAWRSGG